MADIPEELKLPLSLAGLPTTIKDLEDYLKDENKLKKFEDILKKVPAGTEIPPEITNIINNAKANHSENSSGDTSQSISKQELSEESKILYKKLYADFEKALYNTIITDKDDYGDLFRLKSIDGEDKRPYINNTNFIIPEDSKIPAIFDKNQFWDEFIRNSFYPSDMTTYNIYDIWILDIIERFLSKINSDLSKKDKPFRIIYYKKSDLTDEKQAIFKEKYGGIRYIPNDEEIKNIDFEEAKKIVENI
jgi:hypothetical protein